MHECIFTYPTAVLKLTLDILLTEILIPLKLCKKQRRSCKGQTIKHTSFQRIRVNSIHLTVGLVGNHTEVGAQLASAATDGGIFRIFLMWR